MSRVNQIRAYRIAVDAATAIAESKTSPEVAKQLLMGVALVTEQVEGQRLGRATRYVMACIGRLGKSQPEQREAA